MAVTKPAESVPCGQHGVAAIEAETDSGTHRVVHSRRQATAVHHRDPEAPPPRRRGPRCGLLDRLQDLVRIAEASTAQHHRTFEVAYLDPLGDLLRLCDALHQRRGDYAVAAETDQLRGRIGTVGEQSLDGGVRDLGWLGPVEGTRRAAALHVAEDRDPRVLAEFGLEQAT